MAMERDWKVAVEQVASFVLVDGDIDNFALQRYDLINIEWLSDQLQKTLSPIDAKTIVHEDEIYIAFWQDDHSYYRVKVNSIEKSSKGTGNEYHVTFVDYGNKDIIERKDLYNLDKDLKKIPQQSVKCKVKNFILPNGDSYSIGSRRDTQEFFNRVFRRKGLSKVYAVLHAVPWKNSESDPDFEVDICRAEDALNSFVAETYSKVQEEVINDCNEKCRDWLSKLDNPDPIVQEATIKVPEDIIDESKSDVILSVSGAEQKLQPTEYAECIPSISLNYHNSNGSVPCLIERIESPNLFYVYIIEPKEKCFKLMPLLKDMTNYFSAISNSPEIATSFTVGQIVAVYDEEEAGWFRGEIEDLVKDKFQVYLVDFGDSLSVTKDQLRMLPKKFSKLPKLAHACRLKGIKPIKSEIYHQKVTDFFTKLADPTSGKTYYFKYDSEKQEMPLHVDFFTDEACTQSINDELVKNNMAEYIDSKPDWDPMMTDYLSPRPLVPDFTDDFFTPVAKAEENKRLCRFFRFSGRCPSGQNCNFLHLQTGSAFNLKEEDCALTVAHNEVRLPDEGAEFAISIPVVRHPNYFYIHILKNNETKQNTELSLLNEEMTQFYRSWINNKSGRPFIPGEIVAAKFTNGQWYRARIIELIEEEEIMVSDQSCIESVRVFFVDYGRIHTVDLLCLREMKTRFLHLPFQAVECSLGTVMPPPRANKSMKWSDSARQEFHKLTNDQNTLYKAKVLTNNGGSRLEIQLWARRNDDSDHMMDVGEKLVSLRLAHPCKPAMTAQKLVIFPG